MEKLKKYRVHKAICPTCNGNGYVKIMKEEVEPHIHQCWDCDSEGEFYVHEPETIFTDNGINLVTDDDVKLH
jgi:DnaJ-class molecular chaperone